MSKQTEKLLQARLAAPIELRGAAFDAWFWPLVLDSLEPAQRDILNWLLLGETDDRAMSTAELCEVTGSTYMRIGAAVSDLRKLGLLTTEYRTEGGARHAYHSPVGWVLSAYVQGSSQER